LEISKLTLIPATESTGPQVLGLLENTLDQAVIDVQILVSLREDAGEGHISVETTTLLWHIEPGELSPFRAEFEARSEFNAIEAQISSFQISDRERASVETTALQEFPVAGGERAILTSLHSREADPIVVHRIGFMAFGPNEELLALVDDIANLSYLEPGTSTPILATTDLAPGQIEWKIFVDSQPSPVIKAPDFVHRMDPTLLLTQQGMPYILGSLQNGESRARELKFLLIVKNGDQLVGISKIQSPLPVPASGTFVYISSQNHSLKMLAEIEDPGALTFEIAIDRYESSVSDRTTIDLQLRIASIEAIGNSLFIKGEIANPEPSSISSPSLLIEVRDFSGALITGGWFPIAKQIPASTNLEFVLDLPVPSGFEISQAEIDFRPIGIRP
jgi:hypothetical protein